MTYNKFHWDNRSDWELHIDGDCSYDCPFCFDEADEYEQEERERLYDDEY